MISATAGLGLGAEPMAMSRLGRGLALIYHEVVVSPLPPAMAALVRQFEAAMEGDPSQPRVEFDEL